MNSQDRRALVEALNTIHEMLRVLSARTLADGTIGIPPALAKLRAAALELEREKDCCTARGETDNHPDTEEKTE